MYDLMKKLGEGTYAQVYKARHHDTGGIFAIKHITLDPKEGFPSTAMREIVLMKKLKHVNLVKLHEVLQDEGYVSLVYEFCEGDLKWFQTKFGEDRGALPNETAQELMYQLLNGCAYMHGEMVIHRDLKPQNLLISRDGFLKIADFGLARQFGVPVGTFSSEVITLWYRPLDVLMGAKGYGPPMDIWSCGCIFAEMLCGFAPFRGSNNDDQMIKIQKIRGTPTMEELSAIAAQHPEITKDVEFDYHPEVPLKYLLKRVTPEALNLLENIFRYDPLARLTAQEAMEHPYFPAGYMAHAFDVEEEPVESSLNLTPRA